MKHTGPVDVMQMRCGKKERVRLCEDENGGPLAYLKQQHFGDRALRTSLKAAGLEGF